MHRFCQYPQLLKLLDAEKFSPRVRVLAIGKAAWKMASLCAALLAQKGFEHDGFVLTKRGHSLGPIPSLKVLEAGHPIPDAFSLAHSARIVDWLGSIPAREDLVVLLSGGSSALFELLPENATLQELSDINSQLLKSGKSIAEINRKRRELSLLKGGKCLDLVNSKRVHVYAVSDVEGNDPQIIGSGPFTPEIPASKTLDGWRYKPPGKELRYHIVADNRSFCSQLATDLRQQGCKVYLEPSFQNSPLPKFAEQLREILRRADNPRFRLHPPFIQIFGGETPLKVTGPGTGGRCSHLALSLAATLSRYKNSALFCFATDGSDNVCGNGGSYSDSGTRVKLRYAGIELAKAKRDCDSYTALKAIHHILPAPLLATNVNDVFILSVGYDLEKPLSANSRDNFDIFEGIL